MYTPTYTKRFEKQIKDFPKKEQLKILNKITSVLDNPRNSSVKLQNTKPSIYRLRIGDYRIFFQLNDAKQIMEITDVKRRTTQTYR